MKFALVVAFALIGSLVLQEKSLDVVSATADANGPSRAPSISEDGDIIVFESKASNLVSDDTDGEWDVFAHSRKQHRTWRISASDSIPARKPAISGDGTWVAYYRLAFAERAGRGDFVWSVVLHKLESGAAVTLDRKTSSIGRYEPPRAPALSRDGRWIVYTSKAQDRDAISLAYLFDRASSKSELLSVGARGELPDRDVTQPFISPNGRFVVFCTDSIELADPLESAVFEFEHDRHHVFVRDRDKQATRYASDLALKQLGYCDYGDPRVSDDGRFVAYNHFDSRQSGATHVGFVSDLVEGRAGRLLEVDTVDYFQGAVFVSWMSGDGRHVLVESALHLAPVPPGNRDVQIYECDLEHNSWKLLSHGPADSIGNGESRGGVASKDLSVVAFWSDASNLVDGDGNNASDVFVLDKSSGRIERISIAAAK